MAGTTTKGFRYPTAGDNPAVHTDFLNLATDIDTYFDTPQVTTSIIFEGATANAFETTLQAAEPIADATITLPNETGTVTLLTAAQTLTNKTLTSPIISTITSGAATLTLPTTTGTVALTSDIIPSVTNENHARATAFMLGGM